MFLRLSTFNSTVNISENVELRIGANNTNTSFKLYNDGSYSRIISQDGIFVGTDNGWGVLSKNQTSYSIKVGDQSNYNGNVVLYYDGNKKLETIGAGVTVTGTTFSNQLNVSGVSTFQDDVTFTSATTGLGVFYDRSADTLKLLEDGSDNTKLILGDDSTYTSHMEMYHDGGNSGIGYINYRGSNKMILSGNNISFFNRSRSEEMLKALLRTMGYFFFYDNVQKFQTTASGIDVTGTVAATAYTGDGSQLTGITSTTAEWTLGANGSSDYTFTGPGVADNSQDPTIYLVRGQTYKFKNRSGGHPFRIQYEFQNTGGTAYNDGIVNNGAGNGDDLYWEVRNDAPDILYYQCTSHQNMSGKIVILGDIKTDGSWTASSGVAETIDTITGVTNNAIKTAEYTIHFENGSNMQSQKILVMQNGTTAHHQEYAVMYTSTNPLIELSADINSGNLRLLATPATGVNGATTYTFTRQTIR